jgi:hypothetical protein
LCNGNPAGHIGQGAGADHRSGARADTAFLDAMLFTVNLRLSAFVAPRDRQSYPITVFGSRFWMIQNLGYDKSGSRACNDTPGNAQTDGWLYPATEQPLFNPPAG